MIESIWKARSFTVRHLLLPRQKPAIWVSTSNPDPEYLARLPKGELPRLHSVFRRKRSGPWYYPESTGMRKHLDQLFVWFGLLDPTKLPGEHWKSKGYRLEEMGPTRFEKVGHYEVLKMAESIQGQPITGPWSPLWTRESTYASQSSKALRPT